MFYICLTLGRKTGIWDPWQNWHMILISPIQSNHRRTEFKVVWKLIGGPIIEWWFLPINALCNLYMVCWWAFFSYPHEPQTAPRCDPKYSCGLCGLFCYVVNELQNQIQKPYKIAFIALIIRVRIFCSVAFHSKSSWWISELTVDKTTKYDSNITEYDIWIVSFSGKL